MPPSFLTSTSKAAGGFVRRVINVAGAVLSLLGIVWILQGLNVLPGSFMTGQIKWAYYGAVALVTGCFMLFTVKRMK
jgi:membrane-bound ClpP family serine protease